eukprot:TRINITY_DN17536_c0_g1_i1.p3 TRINITY_DN17536_c0_g1~~TRINITY_DN17536_c0_g1_i1.p3  ORF type:complete len:114 (-),score=8.53 TRINITY_DN17536_c0_g1_i1:22-363(-)
MASSCSRRASSAPPSLCGNFVRRWRITETKHISCPRSSSLAHVCSPAWGDEPAGGEDGGNPAAPSCVQQKSGARRCAPPPPPPQPRWMRVTRVIARSSRASRRGGIGVDSARQ